MSDSEVRSLRRLLKTVVVALIANIMVIFGAIWWAASVDGRVSHLETDEIEIKENMIDPMEWKYNDYFTRYLWAERWDQPLPNQPYNTRGASTNL